MLSARFTFHKRNRIIHTFTTARISLAPGLGAWLLHRELGIKTPKHVHVSTAARSPRVEWRAQAKHNHNINANKAVLAVKDEIIAHLLKLLSDKQAELSDKQAEYKTALWLRKTRPSNHERLSSSCSR